MSLLKFYTYNPNDTNFGVALSTSSSGSYGSFSTFVTASPEDVEELEVYFRAQGSNRAILEFVVDSGSLGASSASFEIPFDGGQTGIINGIFPIRVPSGSRLRVRAKSSANNINTRLAIFGQTNTPYTISGTLSPTEMIPGDQPVSGVVRPFKNVVSSTDTASYGPWEEMTTGTLFDANCGVVFVKTQASSNGPGQVQYAIGPSGSEVIFIDGLSAPVVNSTEVKLYYRFYHDIPSGSRITCRYQSTPMTQSLTTAINLFTLPSPVTGSTITGSTSSGSTIIPATPMERIIRKNEFSSSLRTVQMRVLNTDGTAKTDLAAGKAQLSYNAAASITSSVNHAHVDNGYYSLVLSQAEVNYDEGTNIAVYIPVGTGYVTTPAYVTIAQTDIFTSSLSDSQIADTVWNTSRSTRASGTFGSYLDSSVLASTGSLTGSITVNSASIADAVWNIARGTRASGTFGYNVDAQISATGSVTTSISIDSASIADTVWNTQRGSRASGTFGSYLDSSVLASTSSVSGAVSVDSASIADAVWNISRGTRASGTFGYNVDAQISATGSVTTSISVDSASIANTVWDMQRGTRASGTFGYYLDSSVLASTSSVSGAVSVDSASIANAVWNIARGSRSSGTFGFNVDTQISATGAVDTTLIASSVRTNLSTELSKLDASITSRFASSSYTASATSQSIASAVWDLQRGTRSSGTFGWNLDAVVSTATGTLSGSATVDSSSIASAVWAFATRSITDIGTQATTKIANDILDLSNTIETGSTLRGILRIVGAALAGVTSGSDGTTITFKNAVQNDKVRITATMNGTTRNRDTITFDLT